MDVWNTFGLKEQIQKCESWFKDGQNKYKKFSHGFGIVINKPWWPNKDWPNFTKVYESNYIYSNN